MKNSNLALTFADFAGSGRVNLESFTNVEKEYITEEHLVGVLKQGKHTILTKAQIADLIKAEIDKTSDLIEKGETDAKPAKIKADRVMVLRPDGAFSEVYIMSKPVPVEEELNKAEDNDIEKGILDTYNSKFSFEKSGKDIKEKLALVKATLTSKVQIAATQAATILAGLGDEFRPTRTMGDWDYSPYGKDKIGEYLLFEYEMCYYRENTNFGVNAGNNYTKESCASCDKYNDLVYMVVRMKKDICECDTFINNLEDAKKYTLTSEQLITLGF